MNNTANTSAARPPPTDAAGPVMRKLNPAGVIAAARFHGSPLVTDGRLNIIALDIGGRAAG